MPTTQSIDVKAVALDSLGWAFKTLQEDLAALPEDAFDRSFGGKARTVADFVYETILSQDHIRLTITGQELFDFPEGWLRAPEELRTKAAVCNALKDSCESFVEMVRGFSEEELLERVTRGDETFQRFQKARFVAWHAAYHSGQVNYIQTLLGDDDWHWS